MATEQQQPTRGFWNLIALQAQVAFNDNVFKMLLMLAAFDLFSAKPDVQATYNSIIGGLIPAAFLIFSCWGGMLADKFSKRSVILTTKTVELFIGDPGISRTMVLASALAGSVTALSCRS